MGSLPVVIVDEGIELGLLLQEVLPRRFGGLFLQGQVHAFVPTVLLGIPWPDTLDADPEAQPPHRELAQAKEGAVAREGHPVVAADRPWQPEVLESPFKDGKCEALLGGLEGFAAQQVAAGEVGASHSDSIRCAIPTTPRSSRSVIQALCGQSGRMNSRRRRAPPGISKLRVSMATAGRILFLRRRNIHSFASPGLRGPALKYGLASIGSTLRVAA